MPEHILISFQNCSGYETYLFFKELRSKANKDNIGVAAENKEKYVRFNFKVNVRLTGVTNKNEEVCKNIPLRLMKCCTYMTSSLD